MSDQPQHNLDGTPREMPPVTPTQAFPAPAYTQPAQQTGSAQDTYTPYVPPQNTNADSQMPYAMPAAPIQKKRGGSIWVWLLGGCGLMAVLCIVAGVYFVKNIGDQIGKSDLMKNRAAIPTAKRNLMEIRTALNEYTQAHEGKYPASLDKIVDSSLLSYPTSSGGQVKVEYTPPSSGAPDDTSVAGFYVGQVSMSFGQTVDQRSYLRLLKNGSIVTEQVTRTSNINL